MTLPVSAPAAPGTSTGLSATAADPFGLWQAPAPQLGGGLSFGGVGQDLPAEELPVAVWSLNLTSDGGGQRALAVRAQQVQAVEEGLDLASERLEKLLDARARPGALSFAVGEDLPEPELALSLRLDALEPSRAGVSYGLREDLGSLAGRVKDAVTTLKETDWQDMRARVETLFDSVNRQLLHFVWVDTSLDGMLSARTVVGWSGDLSTCCRPGLDPTQTSAHQRSLELALASRIANLKTTITVARLAAKITLAVTTPLGAVQALGLAWDFVNSIVLPMVKKPSLQ